MGSIAVLAAAALAVTFGWAALAKLARPRLWAESLRAYRLGAAARPAALVVPAAEGAVPVTFVAAGALPAALLSLFLLVAFSLATVRARRLGGARLPCACFGGGRRRDYRLLLLRNTGLGALAALAVAGGTGRPELGALEAPGGGDLVAAALFAAGVVLAAWTAREAAGLLRR